MEKQSQFLKDVPFIYTNFIIFVITVPDKKNSRHYFRTAARNSKSDIKILK